MKALWIRVEAHDVDSRDISRFAVALGVSKVMALGHSTVLAGAIAEHTEDGRIDQVEDSDLEDWARWGGKGGRLAKAVRDHLQAPDGTYREWLDTMGKLVERRSKDRDRKELERQAREKAKAEAGSDFHGRSTDSPRKFRGSSSATERNGTRRNETVKELQADSLHSESPNRSASLRSEPRTASALPPVAARFLDRFYPVKGDRRTDVERQLLKLASGKKVRDGKNQWVEAQSVERLEELCADVIAESALIHDLDKAIVILFTKLGDTSDGSAPGAREAQSLAAPDPDIAAIDAWILAHPTAAEELRTEIQLAHDPREPFRDTLIDAELRSRIRQRHLAHAST